ncbi:SpoVK/Ycf46/Vps4 family AAA+-type ATPase [Streptacidiphilus sp. MAP12-33]|uniref:ATP-binding protein n=1 Tax=Streptacidiphilus sp. MAP12-33 TaxID=3156266 RepID=UPI0035188371
MPEDTPLIRSLRAAVATAPADVTLRLHLAELLLAAGRGEEAVAEAAVALQHEPANGDARALMLRAMGAPAPAPALEEPAPSAAQEPPPAFDWSQAEQQVADIVEPRFVEPLLDGEGESDQPGWEIERSDVTLADVGGLAEVKQRLEAAFLAPMRNPELRRLYGKSLRGGLLLYGPPGCGKTFIARAVAGELGARFLSIGLSDVLDMYIGQSERNLHDIFETARRNAPCVLFLDEIDALGGKRSNLRHSAMRGTVNQLLTELDGAGSDNEGVFVLAATNHPWDVDSALRRPGRLDRTLLVLPPDVPAREAILRYHLRDRPVAGVDVGKLVKATEGYSGADLAHLCETAAEAALLESATSGQVKMIGTGDLTGALKQVKPSIEPWLAAARNVALFANEGGIYDDLLAYLKRAGKL